MTRIALAFLSVMALAAPAMAQCIGNHQATQQTVQAPSTPAPAGQIATTTQTTSPDAN